MLKDEPRTNTAPVDVPGGIMLVITSVIFLLAGAHLHGGEESYTSPQGSMYHIGMYALSFVLLGAFILLERRMSNPLVDLQHFRHKYFSLSLVSNVTFHFSMLANHDPRAHHSGAWLQQKSDSGCRSCCSPTRLSAS